MVPDSFPNTRRITPALSALPSDIEGMDPEELSTDALKLLSERSELVLNAVAEGVFCIDTEGRTIFVNDAGARLFGFSPREMLGRRQHDLVHHHYPDGTPFPVEACPIYSSYMEGVTQRVGGDIFWRKDGTQVPVNYSSIPIKDGRHVVGAVVTFRDATAEQRIQRTEQQLEVESAARVEAEAARAALAASEERLRLAMSAGRMGSWEWDIVNDRVLWSPEEEALYGLEPGAFEGTRAAYAERIHPDDRAAAWGQLEDAVQGRAESHDIVHRIVRPNGEVRWIESHGRFMFGEDGAPVRLVGVSIDATDRVTRTTDVERARDAAREAQRQLEAIFESAPSAISVTEGPDHVMRWANAMSRRLIGNRDVIGRPLRETFPELVEQGFIALFDQVYQTGEPFTADEVRVQWDRDGTGELAEAWFNVHYQPVRDADGQISGVMSHSVSCAVGS